MKMIKSLSVLVFILAAYSCKKVDKLTQFNMNYDTSVIIPSSTGVDLPIDFTTPEKETNSESTFELNNTRKDLIESIILTKLDLSVTLPEGHDFSFLNAIRIFLSAEDISESEIAWIYDIPSEPGPYLVLNTTDRDLSEYIIADSFKLRVNVRTDELMTQDYEIKVGTAFFVDAKLIK